MAGGGVIAQCKTADRQIGAIVRPAPPGSGNRINRNLYAAFTRRPANANGALARRVPILLAPRTRAEESWMDLSSHALEYWIGGVIAVGLLVYLMFALIRAERF